jgi:hypothetical protein
MDTAREYAADYFGLASDTLQDAHSGSSSSSKDNKAANHHNSSFKGEGKRRHSNEDEFFALRGFLRAHKVGVGMGCMLLQTLSSVTSWHEVHHHMRSAADAYVVQVAHAQPHTTHSCCYFVAQSPLQHHVCVYT